MTPLILLATLGLLCLLALYQCRQINKRLTKSSERRKAFAANPHRAGPPAKNRPRSEDLGGNQLRGGVSAIPRTPSPEVSDELRARVELRHQRTVARLPKSR